MDSHLDTAEEAVGASQQLVERWKLQLFWLLPATWMAAEGVPLLVGSPTAANMLDAEWWADWQKLTAQGMGVIQRDKQQQSSGHWQLSVRTLVVTSLGRAKCFL